MTALTSSVATQTALASVLPRSTRPLRAKGETASVPATGSKLRAAPMVVMVSGVEATPWLPRLSVAVAVRLWSPAASAWAGVKLQLPSAATAAVPSSCVPSNTDTTALTSAVPDSCGRDG